VFLDGVGNVDKDDIAVDISPRSVDVRVKNLNGTNYVYHIPRLYDEIMPSDSVLVSSNSPCIHASLHPCIPASLPPSLPAATALRRKYGIISFGGCAQTDWTSSSTNAPTTCGSPCKCPILCLATSLSPILSALFSHTHPEAGAGRRARAPGSLSLSTCPWSLSLPVPPPRMERGRQGRFTVAALQLVD